MQVGPDGGQHRLGAIAAPVVGVDVPPAQLQLVARGDRRGPRGPRAPRCAPAARVDAEARERGQRALRVVLDRGALDLGVAHVLVAVQLDGVAAGPDGGDDLRMGRGARCDDEEGRSQRRAAQRGEDRGRPDGIGPVVERQLDGACEGGSHYVGSSRSCGRSSARGQPAVELRRRQRAAEQEPLRHVAFQGGEHVEHLGRLDALGDDLEPEMAREVDGRAHDRRVGRVVGHADDEGAVDLDLVQGQALEVGQGRVTGAEVVQRQSHAQLAQPLEHVAGAARIAHHGVLGDLALQQAAGNLPALQDVGDRLGQRRVDDVRGGEIDRDRQLVARPPPRGALAHRGVEHPARDVGDEAGALGEPEELVRSQEPAFGVLPAHEGLHADDAAAAQRDLGLEVQDELVVVEGAAQLAQELEALGRVGVARGRVGLDVRAGALGLVHGDVGVAQQGRDVLAVVGLERDADRGAELDGDAAHVERERQGAVQAGGHLADGTAMGQDGQDGELVASEAGQDVVAAQHLAQADGDVDEQAVALLMAHRVVDLLEAVEVDEHERGERAVAAGVGQRPWRRPRGALRGWKDR